MSEKSILLDETTLDILQGMHCVYNEYKEVLEWLDTPLQDIGGISPLEVINQGKGRRVLKYVNELLEDNLELIRAGTN